MKKRRFVNGILQGFWILPVPWSNFFAGNTGIGQKLRPMERHANIDFAAIAGFSVEIASDPQKDAWKHQGHAIKISNGVSPILKKIRVSPILKVGLSAFNVLSPR